MPSETFFHLKEEKRRKIDTVLLNEFYQQHVSQVKVAAIVEKSGISRGAFYKYFHDLEDAYAYVVKEYSDSVHADILLFINKNKNDFFYGIEQYLLWCSHFTSEDSNWKKLKLCTQSNLLSRTKRDPISSSAPMFTQWIKLLEYNQFNIVDSDEAISFLHFIMALVMDAITDFISNEWSSEELIADFRYRSRWIQQGIK